MARGSNAKDIQNCRKFTYKQIQDKVAERWQIHNYYEVLMECALHEDETGVFFNLHHPSWKRLLDLVQKHEGSRTKVHRRRSVSSSNQGASDQESIQSETGTQSEKLSQCTGSPPRSDRLHISPSKLKSEKEESPIFNSAAEQASSSVATDAVLKVQHRRIRGKRQKAKTRKEWLELLTEVVNQEKPENPTKQSKVVRQCCQAIGVPSKMRSKVWKVLLGLNDKARPHELLPPNILSPLYNQKTIALDVERTRPNTLPFSEPDVRESMELVLTEYCRRRHIAYVQGMNYVLCPFYLLKLKDSDEVYLFYDAFLRKYLPNTFTDSEFGALQCIFRLFKLLLQYHDPELSAFLDQNEIPPEIYAFEWFMTMYAQKCPVDILLQVWDDLLLNADPRFHYFVSLELLRSQKTALMKYKVEELPEFLSSMTIVDRDQNRRLFLQAKKTANSTPSTFHELLYKCTMQKVVVDGALYTELTDLQAMPIEPKELIEQIYETNKKKGRRRQRRQNTFHTPKNKIKYFVVDCRPLDQYEAGHLPCAFHLDPALNSEALQEKMEGLLTMKGSAFCLFFDGVPAKRTDMLCTAHLLYFLNKRIRYVSICRGGYCGVHQLLSNNLELVDHSQARCLECSGSRKSIASKGNFTSYMKKFYNAAELLKRNNNTESAIPKSVKVLTTTVDVLLTMTVLRDKNTSSDLFHKASDRLVSNLVAEAIEKNNISKLQVETCSQVSFEGVQTVKSIFGVALDVASEQCLREALEVYRPVARTLVGEVRIEEKFTKDAYGGMHNVRSAVAQTPKDIEDQRVILFSPVLGAKNDIHSAVEAMYQLGTRDLTVVAIVASRPTLWVLLDQFPNLNVICAAVDGFTKGRIVPGIGSFAQRYMRRTSCPELQSAVTSTDIDSHGDDVGDGSRLSEINSYRLESKKFRPEGKEDSLTDAKQEMDLGELLK